MCKQYGFIFQGSEIYGGLANTWDFGPVGVELKKNVKNAWMKKFIQEDPNNVGLDSAILMNLQKNSNSICSNSLTLNIKLPGVISFLKLFPTCPIPKGTLSLMLL